MLQPQFEVGIRYWQTVGSTRFNFNSSRQNRALGNPTSVLKYDDMDAYSGEFFWYARNETGTFAKGFVGGGGLNAGSLDDEDYLAGQVKFLDTYSRLKGDDLIYGTIDVGQHFTLIYRADKLWLSPFIGFNFWQETATAYGARSTMTTSTVPCVDRSIRLLCPFPRRSLRTKQTGPGFTSVVS